MNNEDKTKEQLKEELAIMRQKNAELEKDISRARLRKMETELICMNRLNLLGEMAAITGHEIRNPLTSVRGFLQILDYKNSVDKEYLDLMIEELDRANAMITEFLSLTRNKVANLKPANLSSIVKRFSPLIQATAMSQGKSISIQTENVPDTLLDESEIRQIILNLVRNALESMSQGGNIIISTFIENKNVVLSIKDQGHGMDSEIMDKLGTPFLTTKEQGTGLGLSVCYSVAERHNAKIEIDTNPAGTTFYIKFPQLVQCFT